MMSVGVKATPATICAPKRARVSMAAATAWRTGCRTLGTVLAHRVCQGSGGDSGLARAAAPAAVAGSSPCLQALV